jgi:large subunit ribosomal protein L17
MRHRSHRHTLGVKKEHRASLVANLAAQLLTHARIRTTLSRARAVRPFVEKVITLAKKGVASGTPATRLHYYRLALARVRDESAVALLFKERADAFANRKGGYTRIYKLDARRGDAAETALIELVGKDDVAPAKPKPKARKAKAPEAAPAQA